jgi:hypothetical protein
VGKGTGPKAKEIPSFGKTPKASEGRSYYSDHPSWRIGRMDFVDPFGWHTVDSQKLEDIRSKLGQLETRTWGEILLRAKKQNHSVSIEILCKDAQDRLSEMYKGHVDIDDLVSLRLSGRERVWGILDQGVFAVLWWDPEHAVCPSLKD